MVDFLHTATELITFIYSLFYSLFMDFIAWIKEKYVSFSGFIDNILIAIVIFLIGLVIGRLTGNFVKKILKELEINSIFKRATGVEANVSDKIGSFVSYIIYFFAGIMALTQLGLTTTVLTMIAGAVLVVIVLAFVLGVKDFIPNMIAGIMIYRKKLYSVGDYIEVGNTKGEVVNIRLNETEIKFRGDFIFIPNSTVVKSRLKVAKKR